MKRIFYGWYMVGACCAMQFVQSMLLLAPAFNAYASLPQKRVLVLYSDHARVQTVMLGVLWHRREPKR